MMKKIWIIGALALCLLILAKTLVFNQKNGPVVIQAIRQPGYELEMTVQLFNSETKEIAGTYKLNKKNNFIQKDEVPVGKYEISVFVVGMEPRAATKIGGTSAVKEVVVKPEITKKVDKTPRFVVMQGDEEYLDNYFGMVSFQRADGSMLHGEFSDGELNKIQQEAISMQGVQNDTAQGKNGTGKQSNNFLKFFIILLAIIGAGYYFKQTKVN
ncbi:hypothetical protein [Streptococcus ovis]|uniref:hypothetical protein n=1 Tax=Streptococcus ovis TaxID=82806 RepID=UPI0012EAFF45|nr:hypothetical protein [Streptococcus ovis]